MQEGGKKSGGQAVLQERSPCSRSMLCDHIAFIFWGLLSVCKMSSVLIGTHTHMHTHTSWEVHYRISAETNKQQWHIWQLIPLYLLTGSVLVCVLKKSPLGFNDVWMWDSVCFLVSPPRRTGFFLFLFLDCCLSADCQAKSNEHRATSYPTCTESQLSQHLYGKKLIEFRLVFVLEHQKNKNKHSSSSCIQNDTKISRPTDD